VCVVCVSVHYVQPQRKPQPLQAPARLPPKLFIFYFLCEYFGGSLPCLRYILYIYILCVCVCVFKCVCVCVCVNVIHTTPRSLYASSDACSSTRSRAYAHIRGPAVLVHVSMCADATARVSSLSLNPPLSLSILLPAANLAAFLATRALASCCAYAASAPHAVAV